jgi:hypothetical protein
VVHFEVKMSRFSTRSKRTIRAQLILVTSLDGVSGVVGDLTLTVSRLGPAGQQTSTCSSQVANWLWSTAAAVSMLHWVGSLFVHYLLLVALVLNLVSGGASLCKHQEAVRSEFTRVRE